MTPKIITYFLCGMRHPTTGLSEGDLSRLTGSSSSTASCASNSSASSSSSSSSSSTPSPSPTPTPTPSSASSPSISASSTTNTLPHLDGHNIGRNHSPEKISLKNNINIQQHKHNNNNNNTSAATTTTTRFNSTYLPEIINPLEWQKSRKRKDRLDSTSSATLDRKQQRSNSEELLPIDADSIDSALDVKTACLESKSGLTLKSAKKTDVIRRVSSEDFKRIQTAPTAKELQDLETKKDYDNQQEQQTQQEQQDSTVATAIDENDSSWANRQTNTQLQSTSQTQQAQQKQKQGKHFSLECWVGTNIMPTKDMRRRARYETSPARSQRLSPIRNSSSNNSSSNNSSSNNSNKYRDSDDSECEHERRRSSERFCKTRAPPGRKAAGVTKKSQTNSSSNAAKYLPAKRNDENVYKYDLSSLKYERRGFISKKGMQSEKNSANIAAAKNNTSDHNDNNLIDFHQQKPQTVKSPVTSGDEANTSSTTSATTIATASVKPRAFSVPPITSAQEVLPWGRTVPEDQTPILSRRYATVRHHPGDNIDTAAKLSKVMPYPQQYHKQYSATQQLIDDMYDAMEPLNTFRGLTSLTNVNTSDVMQQVLPAIISYQSPDERLKQINKRMTSLKKKLVQYEEAYEARLGFRPSQADRLNDKHMKNILAELSKLRKERHELKTEPVSALGLKVSGNMNAGMKLEKMKSTLTEIEENLSTKRVDTRRSELLDELNADQLVQEKTAVQHGLLYFESLYGRPTTKDERDAARPLYDRYRQLKRLVSRSVVLSGSISGAPELPTILEHEAMVFEATPPQQHSSNNSTETANTPTETVATQQNTTDDSTTTTTTTATAFNGDGDKDFGASVANTNCENIGLLSIEQLWEHFDRVNEEKKLLKRSIREYELIFEEQNGRKMLKNDRKLIEETYAQYKEKKAKARLLQALIKKQIQR